MRPQTSTSDFMGWAGVSKHAGIQLGPLGIGKSSGHGYIMSPTAQGLHRYSDPPQWEVGVAPSWGLDFNANIGLDFGAGIRPSTF